MSKVEELIMLLCPDGVPFYEMGELGKFYGGLTGKSKDDFSDGNAKFITYRNIYSNPALKLDVSDTVKIAEGEKQRTLEYGDVLFTGSSETPDECGISSVLTLYTDEKLYLNSFCFIFRFDDTSIFLPDFAKHLFRSAGLRYQIGKTASGVTRFNVSKKLMEKVIIPVPPLQIQSEIVRILDNFTKLTAELTAELTARKKQYEHYLNELLTFDILTPRIRLGDICTVITKGTTPKSYQSSGIAFVKTEAFDGSRIVPEKLSYVDEETHLGFLKRSILHADDILITIAGATIGKCAMVPANILPANTNQALAIIRLADGNSKKYIMYIIQSNHMKEYMQINIKGSAQPNLNLKQLNDFIIPLPSIEEQERIVAILDRFDALCNDISTGLPAEIEARTKQYEYYRDKLLSFKELL